jgi:hypothetical protein
MEMDVTEDGVALAKEYLGLLKEIKALTGWSEQDVALAKEYLSALRQIKDLKATVVSDHAPAKAEPINVTDDILKQVSEGW